VADLPFSQGPVVDAGATLEEARAAMEAHRTDWVGLVDDGAFLGWVDGRELGPGDAPFDRPRERPAAQVHPESTLREAMEIIMTSSTSVAVIDDGGGFGGVVTLEGIRAALAEGVPERVA
jgi:CBS domain-containing protein